jgi:hypothetical protein
LVAVRAGTVDREQIMKAADAIYAYRHQYREQPNSEGELLISDTIEKMNDQFLKLKKADDLNEIKRSVYEAESHKKFMWAGVIGVVIVVVILLILLFTDSLSTVIAIILGIVIAAFAFLAAGNYIAMKKERKEVVEFDASYL